MFILNMRKKSMCIIWLVSVIDNLQVLAFVLFHGMSVRLEGLFSVRHLFLLFNSYWVLIILHSLKRMYGIMYTFLSCWIFIFFLSASRFHFYKNHIVLPWTYVCLFFNDLVIPYSILVWFLLSLSFVCVLFLLCYFNVWGCTMLW